MNIHGKYYWADRLKNYREEKICYFIIILYFNFGYFYLVIGVVAQWVFHGP